MKISIFLILSTLVFCCNTSINKNFTNQNKLQFKLLATRYIVLPSTFSIKPDSIFILKKSNPDKSKYYVYEIIYKSRLDSFASKMSEISYVDGEKELKRMRKMPLCFNDIEMSNINYLDVPKDVYDNLSKKNVVIKETKFLKYRNKYYFTNTGPSKLFYIYDIQSDSLIIIKNLRQEYDAYLNLRDFYLYDLTGDSVPEVIIFSDRDFIRDKKVISIDILSIIPDNS